MTQSLSRVLGVAALGALAAAAWLTLAFLIHPDFTLEMDRDLPRTVSGFYPPERAPNGDTFAWTARTARVSLPGLDRRVPWTCVVRLRGGRSAPLPQPVVNVGVDGVQIDTRTPTNTLEDVRVAIPARSPRSGLLLTLTSSSTVVPGPADPRELGVQVDRLECRPADGNIALPPSRAYLDAMLAGAIFGGAFGAIGITAGSAVGAALLLAAMQAFPLASGPAPYSPYVGRVPWLAGWIGAIMVLVVVLVEWRLRQRLRQTARFALGFASAVLYLKLLSLLHPSKLLIDAVFHAHRLESVLGGHYLFTQPLGPRGIHFPYAIGLYVFTAPWAVFTRDHVTLLRIVVCAVEALAGVLVYPAIVKTWGDRLAGAIASALFALIPISFWVVGNANLTNAFGQSASTIAVVLVVLWSQRPLNAARVVGWIAVISLALLSHVSTFATLSATLGVMAILFWRVGDVSLRRPAQALLLATTVAIAFSIGIYYGHFGPVYADALRVRNASAPVAAQQADGRTSAQPSNAARAPTAPRSVLARVGDALRLTGQSIGWPVLLLAAIGAWRIGMQPRPDPLALAIVAWTIAFVLLFGLGVMRVGPDYQRYALEFVSRVAYATYPAAVILGGVGAAWAWRGRTPWRIAAIALLLFAFSLGTQEWLREWR